MAPSANRPAVPSADAPEGMPHADEGLRTLIERFRASPGSPEFVELAGALLARGHAAEALRVAEHGLQHHPSSADGRAERAAALLALGRPRVAYVELRRALAIEARHRRALRLLGRAYKDAGVPSRAAELLAQRFATSETAPTSVAFPPAAATQPDAPLPAEPQALPPNLFSNLTVDLGLGSAIPEDVPPRKVEITQIIRRKGMPRPPRSASELVAIEGPIVDTTQPGQIVESEGPPDTSPLDPPSLTPLFDLGDEPLFQDATPFEVRPVASTDIPRTGGSSPDSDTVVESIESNVDEAPPPIDLVGDLADLYGGAQGPLVGPPPPPAATSVHSSPVQAPRPPAPRPFEDEPWPGDGSGADVITHDDGAATDPFGAVKSRLEDVEEDTIAAVPTATPSPPQAAKPSSGAEPGVSDPEAARPTLPLAAAPGLGWAAVERARTVEGRIVIVSPPRSPRRILLAALGAAAMLLYAAALILFSLDDLRPWMDVGQAGAADAVSPAEGGASARAAGDPEP